MQDPNAASPHSDFPDLAYWRKLASKVSDATQLLDDRSPLSVVEASAERREASLELHESLVGIMQSAAASAGVEVATIVAAGWALVLGTHCRSTEIVFGEMSRGQPLRPSPITLTSEAVVRSWLIELQRQRAERSGLEGGFPLQLATLERNGLENLSFDSVVVLEQDAWETRSSCPTALRLGYSLSERQLHADFVPSRVDAVAAQRALNHWRIAIHQLAARLDEPLSSLTLLSDEDRVALDALNATVVEYPQDVCVHQLFEARVRQTPEAIAVLDERQTLTYEELNHRANQLARVLQRQGVGPDVMVGVCVERSVEMVVSLLGILKAGGAYVPLDPTYPEDRLQAMLEDAEPPTVLVQRSTRGTLRNSGAHLIGVDDSAAFSAEDGANLDCGVAPGNLAYVIFTSGSTGRPKGTMNEHGAVVNMLLWHRDTFAITPEDCFLQKTAFSFDVSVFEFFLPLICGARLVMARPGGHKDSAYIAATIQKHAVSIVHFVSSMLRVFLDEPAAPGCTSLRHVFCSGEAVTLPLEKLYYAKLGTALSAKLQDLYGPTEAAVHVTHWECEANSTRHTVPIGRPVANTQVHILNHRGERLPVGVPGELHLGGVQVARGYLKLPELTAERFIADPYRSAPGARLYKTGDLARVHESGVVEYLGRSDFQIKLRGFRIELGEIESAILKHPAVAQAVVVLRTEREDDAYLAAYLVPAGTDEDSGSVKSALLRSLPEFMVPSSWTWLAELPLNPSGKLDRKALPAPVRLRPEVLGPMLPARNEQERVVAAAFASTLGFEAVGAEDSFFGLGGNSLLSMRLLARLREDHAIDIPVARFFQYPTPRALVEYLNRDSSGGLRPERMARGTGLEHQQDDIAIIGLAGRFPGANDVPTLWKNICAGLDSITEFKAEDLDPCLPPELAGDPMYVKCRGIVDGFDEFDANFFGIPPRDAELMDPQQRIFLEVCWEALENSGYVPETASGLVGIFAGAHGNTYLTNHVLTHPEYEQRLGSFGVAVQNEGDYVATRVAHKFDLLGPAVSLSTACSTSLVAVVEAFHCLRAGRCDMALAGGASIACPPRSGYWYIEGGMLSPDGHTRSFDANANGTCFNDGVAAVVLKRLRDAVSDGDTIYGVLRGAAVNNDGARKASFTAPSVEGQVAVIRTAQQMAGVNPRSITYVETHGTATPIGDPIEVEALTEAFRSGTDELQFCTISSIKSNIGHLIAAAGAAGLIKAALALHNKVLPPTAHFVAPNPRIDFASTPFYVSAELRQWPAGDGPRRAAVSSFGVGGTNAHVVLEEAPSFDSNTSPRPQQLLMLSARSASALDRSAERLSLYLSEHPDVDLADVAFTLANGRRNFPERRFVVASSASDAAAKLSKPSRTNTRHYDGSAPSVAFLFPGQGAQYANMGRALYRDEPVFRTVVDECKSHLDRELDRPLLSLLYPEAEAQDEASEALRNTAYTQPALFTVEYATAQVLLGWGIKPDAMVGHSIGEFVCAVLAGVMSLKDALSIVAARGKLMQNLPKGAMLSVRLPAAEILDRLGPDLALASDNGPSLCVVAGPCEAVAAFGATLEAEGVVCRHLQTSHAFHSPMMEPVVSPFAELISKIKLSPPKIRFVSTLTGKWISDEEATNPMYWARHLRDTVQYSSAIQVLLETPGRVLLEAGPRATLTTLARQHVADAASIVAVPSLGDNSEGDAEWSSLLGSLGRLWAAGVTVDWRSFFIEERRRRIPLPSYPFERKRYWISPAWAPSSHHPSTMAESSMPRIVAPIVAPQADRVASPTPVPLSTSPAAAQLPRRLRLVTELKEVFEHASGFDMDAAAESDSFLELGLDSLSLTQIALQLQKQFGVRVTFRELMDAYASLEALSGYLDEQMPAEEPVAEPTTAPLPSAATTETMALQSPFQSTMQTAAAAAPALTDGTNAALIQLVQQQLLFTQQLLGTLAGMPVAGGTPMAPALASAALTSSPQRTLPQNAGAAAAQTRPTATSTTPVEADSDSELDVRKKAFGAIAKITTERVDDLTPRQRAKLDAFTRRYNARTRRSKQHTQDFRGPLADPRAVTGFRPQVKELVYQIVIERSSGSRVWDVDGNEYVDALNGFGSSLFGWQPKFLNEAIMKQLERGHEIGPMPPLAGEVAQLICEFTGFDRAGFCNTGSEAVMGCMRVARTVTGRTLVASFNNSYHGIFDEVIVRGTKKLRPVPAAPGIMHSGVQNMLVLDYGTPESLEILRARGHELAAILIEPVQSRRPDFQPREFMHEARKIADECGAVLIFDEVITGFRSHPGGAQALFGVRADLGSYGKVIGGGLPFGVVAGKKQFMDALDGGFWEYGDDSLPTVGVTYFAGTFCRHPLALAAAKASLLELKRQGPQLQERLTSRTAAMAAELNTHFRSVGVPIEIRWFSSLWKVILTEDLPYGDLLFYYLRDRGLHILEGFPCFLTVAHSDEDIALIVRAFKDSVAELQEGGFLPGETKSMTSRPLDTNEPPVPGARLGRDRDGTPTWFVPHPDDPKRYVKLGAL